MKQYKCDVCGADMPVCDPLAHYADKESFYGGMFGGILSNRDVCSRCMEVGHKLSVEKVFLAVWKKASESGVSDED